MNLDQCAEWGCSQCTSPYRLLEGHHVDVRTLETSLWQLHYTPTREQPPTLSVHLPKGFIRFRFATLQWS